MVKARKDRGEEREVSEGELQNGTNHERGRVPGHMEPWAEGEQRGRRPERGEQNQSDIPISGTFWLTLSWNFAKYSGQ